MRIYTFSSGELHDFWEASPALRSGSVTIVTILFIATLFAFVTSILKFGVFVDPDVGTIEFSKPSFFESSPLRPAFHAQIKIF